MEIDKLIRGKEALVEDASKKFSITFILSIT